MCMGLVRDPLTRSLERRYLEAARALSGHFFVLTNGEHIGPRGVNGLVEKAFDTPEHPRREGLYLPGLAGGGVQLQDAFGKVSHPGVSDAELAFLASVPVAARAALQEQLAAPPFTLNAGELSLLCDTCVLDNAVSPTLNLNPLYERYAHKPAHYRKLQQFAEAFMREQLRKAADQNLVNAFFLHLAPNAGKDERGERIRLSDGSDAGTTDFQLMLSGAVKEVGVLVLLNHFLHQATGSFPLGAQFNAREAPDNPDDLLELASTRFRHLPLPRIIGIGDTVTSHREGSDAQRGGSDRGFLQLVQELGREFGTDNANLFVDSSGGEVKRPGVAIDQLHVDGQLNWSALRGISDPEDPLCLNFLFHDGHRQYVEFFCALAARKAFGTRTP